jgi:hypothetical protein
MCTRLIGPWMPHIFMCERKKWRQSDQNLLPKETKWHGTVWWGFRSFPNCNGMFWTEEN